MTDEEEFSARTSGWGTAALHHVLRIFARISCGISSLVGSAQCKPSLMKDEAHNFSNPAKLSMFLAARSGVGHGTRSCACWGVGWLSLPLW